MPPQSPTPQQPQAETPLQQPTQAEFSQPVAPVTQTQQPSAPQQTQMPQYDYKGENVQIGGGRFGMKPLAQRGTIIIQQGTVYLLGSDGQAIAQAPIAQCIATQGPWYVMGQGAWLTIQGVRYFVAVNHGSALNMATSGGVFEVMNVRSATKKFLEAFKAASARGVVG